MIPDSQALPLFDDIPDARLNSTGSAWRINASDPATVPVPLQVVINKVDGPYTERDRKLWTFLLHAVWDEIGVLPVHELNVADINRVFRQVGSEHDSDWIWECAKRLSRTVVEWEYTFGDERLQGTSSIFSAVITKSSRQAGRMRFNFPPLLIPVIKQPTRFARLRVHFLIKLSGKYAVTLYEILEGYVNTNDGTVKVELEELRHWLKVPEDSYRDWKDFRKRVLEPAVAQINDDSLGSGFTVTYSATRQGRFYNAVIFKLTKTTERKTIESGIRRNLSLAKKIDASRDRPVIRPETYTKARKAAPGLDVHGAEAEFWGFWESQGRQQFAKSADAAFIGFCRKRIQSGALL